MYIFYHTKEIHSVYYALFVILSVAPLPLCHPERSAA